MIAFRRLLFSRLGIAIWVITLSFACPAMGQAKCSGNAVADDDNYRVRHVTVNSLFGSVPAKLRDILAKHRNELYRTGDDSFVLGTPGSAPGSSLDRYRREVFNFFEKDNTFKEDASFGVNQQEGLYVRATFSSTCVEIVPAAECEAAVTDDTGHPVAKCLDVEIKIRVIPINTASPSSNLLDLARSNQVRFYRELPRPLLALNPSIGIEHDNSYGTSFVGSIATDLLSLPSILDDSPKTVQKTQLRFGLDVRKSLKTSFYDINSTLALAHTEPLKFFEKLSASGNFAAVREIKGDGIHTRNSISAGFGALIKLNGRMLDRLRIGADYRRTNNRFADRTGLRERINESTLAGSIAADGHVGGGFIRAAAWLDYSSPESITESYGRFAGTVGYSKNFVLPQKKCTVVRDDGTDVCVFPEKNPPVIGLEVLAGGAKAWGTVPQFARFYGGNNGGSFLYDAIDGVIMTRFPDGPLIRSLGRNKAGSSAIAGVRGGTSYSHLNMTVSLPVQAWSRPLIPAVGIVSRSETAEALTCSQCASLKDVLKNQVEKGKNIYIDAMASRSLTDEQRDDLALERSDGLTAEEEERLVAAEHAFEDARHKVTPEADEVWQQLTPTVAFIADNANLYSVKPLVMFDIARISADTASDARTRVGVGGGLQFNVVIAKFELGYVRTIRRLAGDAKGNFVVRMVFEKLF